MVLGVTTLKYKVEEGKYLLFNPNKYHSYKLGLKFLNKHINSDQPVRI